MPIQPKNTTTSPAVLALPRLLDIKEAAYVLHVSVRTIGRLIQKKQITYMRVRGSLRFAQANLDEYLRKRTIVSR
jgi:excisionase family DNA binding protein